jgi:hypothetical protein
MAFETPIEAVVALDVSVAVTTATTPLAIVLEFIPSAMHVYPDAPPEQVIDLPAAVEAAPGATLRLLMLALGYVNVHCRAAGCPPDGEETDRFRATVPLGAPVPDESVSAG